MEVLFTILLFLPLIGILWLANMAVRRRTAPPSPDTLSDHERPADPDARVGGRHLSQRDRPVWHVYPVRRVAPIAGGHGGGAGRPRRWVKPIARWVSIRRCSQTWAWGSVAARPLRHRALAAARAQCGRSRHLDLRSRKPRARGRALLHRPGLCQPADDIGHGPGQPGANGGRGRASRSCAGIMGAGAAHGADGVGRRRLACPPQLRPNAQTAWRSSAPRESRSFRGLPSGL